MKRRRKGTKRPSENEARRGRRDGERKRDGVRSAGERGARLLEQAAEAQGREKKNRKAMRMRIDEAQRREESFHQQVCWMKPGDKSPSGRSLGLSACTGCLSPSVICLIAWLREINGCS